MLYLNNYFKDEYSKKRREINERNNNQLRDIEKAHAIKLNELHVKFEQELEAKKKFLDDKRKGLF